MLQKVFQLQEKKNILLTVKKVNGNIHKTIIVL